MSGYNIDVADMQCWVFRMAQSKSYEEALLRFTNSRAYEALFDFDTEIWKEGSDYLLSLYNYCTSKKTA